MDLKDTVELMLSDDYKDRFKAEYYQTAIRFDKLKRMINKYKSGELDFDLDCPIDVLERQKEDMAHYLFSLNKRAEIEGIDIHATSVYFTKG